MTRGHSDSPKAGKRRTTVTLLADSLATAQRIARTRKVTLSTVISEAVDEGLRVQRAAERSAQVIDAYRRAFSRFTDEEVMLLDGVVLGEHTDR